MNIHKAREHIALHHQGADGWIALIRKESGRFAGQKHFRPEEISAVLSEWIGEDVYFSQNTFYRPQRRVENVRQLRAVYDDVDHYLLNYSPEWVIGKMETELFGERVPDPNLIIHSGRQREKTEDTLWLLRNALETHLEATWQSSLRT